MVGKENNKSPALLNRLAGYYRDLLFSMHSGAAGKHFIDINEVLRNKLTADLGLFVQEIEALIEGSVIKFIIDKPSSNAVSKIMNEGDIAEEKREQSSQGRLFEDEEPDESPIDPQAFARNAASSIIVAIYRRQEFDPFNREVIIGFPIISGTLNGRKYCAPLLYYRVSIEFDPLKNLVTLTKDHEVPALNFHLIKSIVESDEEIEIVRKQILPCFYQDDFSTITVAEIIKKLSVLIAAFSGLAYRPSKIASLIDTLNNRNIEKATVFNASVIINAARSNAYLLDDLAQLAQIEVVDNETVVNAFLDGPPDCEMPDDESDPAVSPQALPLFYPLQSNKAQRLAAVKAEKARLMVIQGPPGTGKSQTIVNLICHLVAHGKTVLVSSHQNKALEVITNNMPEIQYLAMSLFKGERESLNELTNKIDGFSTYIGMGNRLDFEDKLKMFQEELIIKDKAIKFLQARFSELKRLEREKFPNYRSYHELRDYNLIEEPDLIPEGSDLVVNKALDAYLSLLKKIKHCYHDLERLLPAYDPALTDSDVLFIPCNSCNTYNRIPRESLQSVIKCGRCKKSINLEEYDVETATENVGKIIHFYDWLSETILEDQRTLDFCLCFAGDGADKVTVIAYLDKLIEWVENDCKKLVANLKTLSD